MIDPSIGKALADLGGFALFLLTVVTGVVGLHRQWWVPGFFYRDVIAERDAARAELKEARATNDRLTVQLARERRGRGTDRAGA